MVWISIADVREKQSALMTVIPGFSDFIGLCTFLDCDQRPSFHRGILHPVGLGMGEWRFIKSPEFDVDVLFSRTTRLDKIRAPLSKFLKPSARI